MQNEPSDGADRVPDLASSPVPAYDPPPSEPDGATPGRRQQAWLGMAAVAAALVLLSLSSGPTASIPTRPRRRRMTAWPRTLMTPWSPGKWRR